jgi:16S rRNA (guanine1207-N2)-methyltransferase
MSRSRPSKKRTRKVPGPGHKSRPPEDQRLIDALPQVAAETRRILCTTLGSGQLAAHLAALAPQAEVHCSLLDLYDAHRAGERVGGACENLTVACEADFPAGAFDLVALPFRKRDSSELTRERIQSGFLALPMAGRFAVSFDSAKDHWLHEYLRSMFDKVTRTPRSAGIVYEARKRRPLKKLKDYACEFAFRDGERLIRLVSRPGVFSHRRLDGGARALIKTMQVAPGDRVLDLGCGSGAVALAAAARHDSVQVVALDSSARALQCTLRGAELNGLTNVTTQLDADGRPEPPGAFDLVLANPPYYSNYEIAKIFIRAALRALKPGGRLLVVTKSYDWFGATMSDYQDDVVVHEVGQYFVVAGVQRRETTIVE